MWFPVGVEQKRANIVGGKTVLRLQDAAFTWIEGMQRNDGKRNIHENGSD